MRRRWKYSISIFLIVALFCSMNPVKLYAMDSIEHDECSFASDICTIEDISGCEEIIVEVESEEETLTYAINPNYRYIFIYDTPAKTRAVCYMCGRSAMGTVTRKIQYDGVDRMCPNAGTAAVANDHFMTWHHYTRERCTACGYSSEEWLDRVSYTALCCNGHIPGDSEQWTVKYEYTAKKGYDLHQSLRWWTDYLTL